MFSWLCLCSDANLTVKSINQENSRLSSRALGSGDLLATPEVVTARGSDISFYTIGGVDFEVTETLDSKVLVPLGIDEDEDGDTDEIEEAFKWMPDTPTEISAPDPGAFQSTYYDVVVINLGQGIFKITYNDGSGNEVYNQDSGYGDAAGMTPPYIYNQVSATLDPKIGFDEDGPRALGLTASNIILVDRQIINRIVYVPSTVFVNVGLNSSTLNSEMAGATPSDIGVATITTSDYSYLTSSEIKFIESFFKEESAYDIFGFLLIPFDGIDLRVEDGEIRVA